MEAITIKLKTLQYTQYTLLLSLLKFWWQIIGIYTNTFGTLNALYRITVHLIQWSKTGKKTQTYCWWRKSCTSWYWETTKSLITWFYASQVQDLWTINSSNQSAVKGEGTARGEFLWFLCCFTSRLTVQTGDQLGVLGKWICKAPVH